MKYNIQVEVDIEELEDNVGHVNDIADALAGMMSGNEYLGVTIISIEEMVEEGTLRASICEGTGNKVLQEYMNGEWICLHNETVEEDIKEAEEFEKRKK